MSRTLKNIEVMQRNRTSCDEAMVEITESAGNDTKNIEKLPGCNDTNDVTKLLGAAVHFENFNKRRREEDTIGDEMLAGRKNSKLPSLSPPLTMKEKILDENFNNGSLILEKPLDENLTETIEKQTISGLSIPNEESAASIKTIIPADDGGDKVCKDRLMKEVNALADNNEGLSHAGTPTSNGGGVANGPGDISTDCINVRVNDVGVNSAPPAISGDERNPSHSRRLHPNRSYRRSILSNVLTTSDSSSTDSENETAVTPDTPANDARIGHGTDAITTFSLDDSESAQRRSRQNRSYRCRTLSYVSSSSDSSMSSPELSLQPSVSGGNRAANQPEIAESHDQNAPPSAGASGTDSNNPGLLNILELYFNWTPEEGDSTSNNTRRNNERDQGNAENATERTTNAEINTENDLVQECNATIESNGRNSVGVQVSVNNDAGESAEGEANNSNVADIIMNDSESEHDGPELLDDYEYSGDDDDDNYGVDDDDDSYLHDFGYDEDEDDGFDFLGNNDHFRRHEERSNADRERSQAVQNLMNKEIPKYTWNTIAEVMKREYGAAQNMRDNFTSRFYSSMYVVERMNLTHNLRKHRGCVNSLNFDRSGQFLSSGSDDRRIIVWDWSHEKIKHVIKSGHRENIFQTKFLNSEGMLDIVSTSRDGQVRRHLVPSYGKTQSSCIYKHHGAIHKLVTCPGTMGEIITVGEDSSIRHKDLRVEGEANSLVIVKKDVGSLCQDKVRLFSVSHHPYKNELCVCGDDRYVRVYDKRQFANPVYKMCPTSLVNSIMSQITCCSYDYTGREILATYSDDHIYLFNNESYESGSYLHRYQGHYNHRTIKGVNFFGPHSEYIISGSDCGHIFFWDKSTEAIVNYMPADDMGVVNCLEPHNHMPVLATSGLDHNIKVWAPGSDAIKLDKTKLEQCVRRNLKRSVGRISTTNASIRPFHYFIRQILRSESSLRMGSEDSIIDSFNMLYDSSSSSSNSGSSSSSSFSNTTGTNSLNNYLIHFPYSPDDYDLEHISLRNIGAGAASSSASASASANAGSNTSGSANAGANTSASTSASANANTNTNASVNNATNDSGNGGSSDRGSNTNSQQNNNANDQESSGAARSFAEYDHLLSDDDTESQAFACHAQ